VIGAVIDRTGNNSSPTWPDALKLAESIANEGLARANITSFHFEILIQDSLNNPATALTRSLSLVRDQGAKAIITDSSQNDNLLMKSFYDSSGNALNVPIQCGGCTSGKINSPTSTDTDPANQKGLQNPDGWNFRSIMASKLEAFVLLRELLSKGNGGDINGDNVFKVSIYASNESFGKATAQDLYNYATQTLRPAPCPTTGTIPGSAVPGSGCTDIETIYAPGSPSVNTYNWTADLAKLTDNNNEANGLTAPLPTKFTGDGYPDAIIVVGFAEHYIPFVENYKLNHYTIPVYHFHNFRNITVLTALGSTAEGERGISHVIFDPVDSPVRSLTQNRYGHDLAYRDTTFFDAATTFMLATVFAARNNLQDPFSLTGQQIRDAMGTLPVGVSLNAVEDTMASLTIGPGAADFAQAAMQMSAGFTVNYNGASGPMDYDANQNVKQKLVLFHVENGIFVDDHTFDCTHPNGADLCPQVN